MGLRHTPVTGAVWPCSKRAVSPVDTLTTRTPLPHGRQRNLWVGGEKYEE